MKAIASHDSWVLSDKGIETLHGVLERNPHLMQSPEGKWTAAYKHYLGEEAFRKRSDSQVKTPNPKPRTAPVAPVQGGERNATPKFDYRKASKEQLDAHLKKLTPEQEQVFWDRVFREQKASQFK